MSKRMITILIIAIVIGLSLSLRSILFAQRYYQQQEMVSCDELEEIQERLESVVDLLEEKGNKEILRKLDQILENQAQIKDELRIIKVRASR